MNKFYSYLYLPHDRFIAVGAYRNNPHGHARFPLDELHISLEFGREILVANEYQTAGNGVLICIALLILGSKFLIGDDESKARGRKQVPYIIIGTAIIMSAFNIAASAGASLTF